MLAVNPSAGVAMDPPNAHTGSSLLSLGLEQITLPTSFAPRTQ